MVITYLSTHYMTKNSLQAFYLYQMTSAFNGDKVAAEH
ncbi:Uncharacterised protein [Escherichia coli]|nr:Uncharacterised protein [Escherichia coli]